MARRMNDGVKTLAGKGRGGSRPKPPKAVVRSTSIEAPRPLADHEKAKRCLTAKTVAFSVFGALLSGFAIVLLLVIPLRGLLRLEDVITGRHFDVLCKLLLTSSLCMAYTYLMDVFTTYYGGDRAERTMFTERTFGYYMAVYWGTIVFNVLLPQLLWFRRSRINQPVVVLICLGVVVGMWLERYEIVVTSLHRPHLPSSWGSFHGTFWDWATLFGTVGMFLSGILLAVRYVPIISMHEMRSLIATSHPDKVIADLSQ